VLRIEENGINVITESERRAVRESFWPWFGANLGLGLAYGAFILGFGISFWQALIVGFVGIVISSCCAVSSRSRVSEPRRQR